MRNRYALTAAVLALVLAAPTLTAARREGFELTVVVDGCEAPEFSHEGKLYVEALRGRNFTLRLSNPTGERVAVALSVATCDLDAELTFDVPTHRARSLSGL